MEEILNKFRQKYQEIYGANFFLRILVGKDDQKKIVLMTEKLASELRESLAGIKSLPVVSLDKDKSVGDYYQVASDVLPLYNHPGAAELQRIQDSTLVLSSPSGSSPTVENEVIKGELLRGLSPKEDKTLLAVAVCHDFEDLAPNALGWIKASGSLTPLTKRLPFRPTVVQSLDDIVASTLNKPYRKGGKSLLNGFDCAGLVQHAFLYGKRIWLPRQALWQSLVAVRNKSNIPDLFDLAFFSGGKEGKIFHVGVVCQTPDVRILQSSSSTHGVTVTSPKDVEKSLALADPQNPVHFQGYWKIDTRNLP